MRRSVRRAPRRTQPTRDEPKSALDLQLRIGLGFIAEYPFKGRSGTRRWRFDWARPDLKVAVEYDGLGRAGAPGMRGGHETRNGMSRDREKSNEAALCGWLLIRCTVDSVRSGHCISWIEDAVRLRQDTP